MPVFAGNRDLGKDVVDNHCLYLVLLHVLFEKDGCYCADVVQDAVFLASVESRVLENLHDEEHCLLEDEFTLVSTTKTSYRAAFTGEIKSTKTSEIYRENLLKMFFVDW